MKKIIYNEKNLKEKQIDEFVIRSRGIIINNNNEVLMTYCEKEDGYEFPGGHLEDGETLEEGLQRELKEETGINFETNNMKPFITIQYYIENYRQKGEN